MYVSVYGIIRHARTHLHTHTRPHVLLHVLMCMQKLEKDTRCPPYCSLPIPLRQGFLLNLELTTFWLGLCTASKSSWSRDSIPPPPPPGHTPAMGLQAQVTDHVWHFLWVPGTWTQVFLLAQKLLLPTEPSPQTRKYSKIKTRTLKFFEVLARTQE